jgi:hypothetical protein
MSHPLVTDEMVTKAHEAAQDAGGYTVYDTDDVTTDQIRAALEAVAPDIVEAVAEYAEGHVNYSDQVGEVIRRLKANKG